MDAGLVYVLGVTGWVIVIILTLMLLSVNRTDPPLSPLGQELAKAEAAVATSVVRAKAEQERRLVLAEGRVRVLHAPEPGRTMIGPERLHCRSCLVLWPCQTIRALDEPTNPATHVGREYTGRPIGEPPNPSEKWSGSEW